MIERIVFTPTAVEDNASEEVKIQRHYEGKEPYVHDYDIIFDAVEAYVGDSPVIIKNTGDDVEITNDDEGITVRFSYEDGLLFGASIFTNFPIKGSHEMSYGGDTYHLTSFKTNELLRILDHPNAVAEFVWFVMDYVKDNTEGFLK